MVRANPQGSAWMIRWDLDGFRAPEEIRDSLVGCCPSGIEDMAYSPSSFPEFAIEAFGIQPILIA
jgi:hypothetical protein